MPSSLDDGSIQVMDLYFIEDMTDNENPNGNILQRYQYTGRKEQIKMYASKDPVSSVYLMT